MEYLKWVPVNGVFALAINVSASCAAYAEYGFGDYASVNKGAFGMASAFGFLASIFHIVNFKSN